MAAASHSAVDFRSEGPRDGTLKLIIAGRLDAETTGTIWRRAVANVKAADATNVVVEASGIEYCDGAGIALLVQLRELQRRKGENLEITGLRAQFADLLNDSASNFPTETKGIPPREGIAEEIGHNTVEIWRDMQSLVSFVGELSVGLVRALIHPSGVRWRDALSIAEAAGVNALPIVALVSFLMGLIMAFQAAIPLRQFGAQLFIANLIGLSMLRELGPLMTAVILAGRSGSAFAAELGTMKVREEIDALKTMASRARRESAVDITVFEPKFSSAFTGYGVSSTIAVKTSYAAQLPGLAGGPRGLRSRPMRAAAASFGRNSLPSVSLTFTLGKITLPPGRSKSPSRA